MQAETATTIITAVDDTAVAAGKMSGTIAAIRTDSERVASEIDAHESAFLAVNRKLAELENAARNYVEIV